MKLFSAFSQQLCCVRKSACLGSLLELDIEKCIGREIDCLVPVQQEQNKPARLPKITVAQVEAGTNFTYLAVGGDEAVHEKG